MEKTNFDTIIDFLEKVPSVQKPISVGEDNGLWWIKFSIDINHKLAWSFVQEFGHILNYISIDKRLPTVFFPVSPPPYMNGGPENFLSWVIQTTVKDFSPDALKGYLEGRLTRHVNNEELWGND